MPEQVKNCELKSAMDDCAVTNVSNWTESDSDSEDNEEVYRQRMAKNAPLLHAKIKETMQEVMYAQRTSWKNDI